VGYPYHPFLRCVAATPSLPGSFTRRGCAVTAATLQKKFYNLNNSNVLVLLATQAKPATHATQTSLFSFQKSLFHSRCRAINRIGPHDIDVISVIFGLLLGDGYANNKSGEGMRISVKQSIIHKEYLFSLYEFFLNRGYCSNLEPRKYSRTIKGINKIYYGYEFNTYTFRSFVWIYKLFYKNGKKVVPLNIEEFLTPLTLAIWICDDGG
jgi:hypothetical protein